MDSKRRPIIIFSSWLVASVLLTNVTPVFALVVAPARTEIHLKPGKTTELHLTTTNDDKVEIQVNVSKKDWLVSEANKGVSVSNWLDVHGPAQFYLKPGESRTIDLKAKCPKVLVGEVVGMVSFLYRTEATTNVTPMISVSMYLMAAGQEKIAGNLKNIIVRSHDGQLVVTALVRDTGNVHIRPNGTLELTTADGTPVSSMPVAEGSPTFPGTENIYSVEFPKSVGTPPGQYVAKANLSYQDLPLRGSLPFTISPDGQIQTGLMK